MFVVRGGSVTLNDPSACAACTGDSRRGRHGPQLPLPLQRGECKVRRRRNAAQDMNSSDSSEIRKGCDRDVDEFQSEVPAKRRNTGRAGHFFANMGADMATCARFAGQ